MKWIEMNSVGKIHRVSRAIYLMKIPILPKALMSFNRIIFSCDIPYSAEVHPSVMFGHNGLGTVIHSKATIGENSLIMQHVTIGGNKSKKNVYKGKEITSPVIGKNVFIGPGAMILGAVIIGDNVQIGAGSLVLEDIPKNGVAVGSPAKVIKILSDEEVVSAKS